MYGVLLDHWGILALGRGSAICWPPLSHPCGPKTATRGAMELVLIGGRCLLTRASLLQGATPSCRGDF